MGEIIQTNFRFTDGEIENELLMSEVICLAHMLKIALFIKNRKAETNVDEKTKAISIDYDCSEKVLLSAKCGSMKICLMFGYCFCILI